ncbi:MAG TPA: ATP-binding cassette domain-containing protein, partial [Acidimicrobiales bacterium]|nr:ATP-binding cassette domain-containing protein [Acidimicrobiales bacterium]
MRSEAPGVAGRQPPAPPSAGSRRGSVVRGRLRPGELAEAAVLGDLGLVLEVLGWFSPIGISGLFQALAVIPFAVLAARHRLRAAIVATIAAAAVGSLVGGIGIMIPTAVAAALGSAAGVSYRRRWSPWSSLGFMTLVVGVPVALGTLALEAISPGYRKLSFDQVKIVWKPVTSALARLGLGQEAQQGNTILNWIIVHWYLSLPLAEFFLVFLVAAACLRLKPFLIEMERRVPAAMHEEATERRRRKGALPAAAEAVEAVGPPRPVPVRLDDVTYRYPGTVTDAVSRVSIALEPGRFLAIVGPNGSGKSTVVRLLSGRLEPRSGTVVRSGPAGLGLPGGTAIVFQRPESQVLGVRVRDDICWGLPAVAPDIMRELLSRVGLEGFEERETATMSGGELQRLAIASALARSPQLLVSDESTAMIDQPGRTEVVALLRRLASSGLAIVHVTHRKEEAAVADEIIVMRDGRVVREEPERAQAEGATAAAPTGETAFTATPPPPLPPAERPWRMELSPKPTPSMLRPPRPLVSFPPDDLVAGLGAYDDKVARGVDTPDARRSRRAGTRPLVWLKEVGYTYAQGTPWAHRALTNVDLQLWPGEGVVITGPNGSGKSTLAWILAGLTPPTEGDALLDSRPIVEEAERVGIAFQHARLQLLRPTVMKDVSLGADEERARRALVTVGLDPDLMGPRRVDDLSGGEQRRVA